MANKAYWNMLDDIMEATTTICDPNMSAADKEEMQVLRKDIRARQATASDKPMEEITLASLGKEFIEILTETCDNYHKAESKEEKDAIIKEIKEASLDVFNSIAEETSEVFASIGTRFEETFDETYATSIWKHITPIPGDHIKVNRLGGLYTHHGIYIGDNIVIHFAPTEGCEILDWSSAKICKTTLDDFCQGSPVYVRQYSQVERENLYPVEQIIANANNALGSANYNLIFNNCEHFANACTLGTFRSPQIEELFKLATHVIDA